MVADYADWGGLTELQNFLTSLNLAVQSDQATASAIGTAVGNAVAALDLAVAADQATASAISASIAAAGVPLLNGLGVALNDTSSGSGALSIAAGATSYATASLFSGCGYQIQAGGTIPGNDATPWITVTASWYDNTLGLASGGALGIERWVIPLGTAANTVYGRGPTTGDRVQFAVKNWCTTETATVSILLEATTHHIQRDDWRHGAAYASLSTFDGPGGGACTAPPVSDPPSLILGAGKGVSVGSGDTVEYILSLYAGQVNLAFSGSETYLVELWPLDPELGTITTDMPALFSESVASTSSINAASVTLPRCPCALQITNTNSTAGTVIFNVTAQEYAS